MDTVGKAPLLCEVITSSDQSNPDWSLNGQYSVNELERSRQLSELLDVAGEVAISLEDEISQGD